MKKPLEKNWPMTQSFATNVLTGVQYGAGGTEFTGTATVGGGGFISIVNE